MAKWLKKRKWGGAMLFALLVASCAGETDSLNSFLKVETTESGPAKGDVIANAVRPDGSVVCLKADGGFFTSPKGGAIEFYLNGSYSSRVYYGPQAAPYKLKEIKSSVNATTLGVGEHRAQCIAMPNIDIKADPNWAGSYCLNSKTRVRDVPCYRSGVYNFRIVKNTGICLQTGKYPCTTIGPALPRKVPPGTKCYSYRFVTMRKPVVVEGYDHVNVRIFEDVHPDCKIEQIGSSKLICENRNHGDPTNPSTHTEEINFRTTRCFSSEVNGCHPDGKLYLKSHSHVFKTGACENEFCDSRGFVYAYPFPRGIVVHGTTKKLPPNKKKYYHNSNSDALAQAAFFAFHMGEYPKPGIQKICALPQEQFPNTWDELIMTISIFDQLPIP